MAVLLCILPEFSNKRLLPNRLLGRKIRSFIPDDTAEEEVYDSMSRPSVLHEFTVETAHPVSGLRKALPATISNT